MEHIRAFGKTFYVKSLFICIRAIDAQPYLEFKFGPGDRMVFHYKLSGASKYYATIIDKHEDKYGVLFKVATDMVKSEIKWNVAYVWISTSCLNYDIDHPCPQSGVLMPNVSYVTDKSLLL